MDKPLLASLPGGNSSVKCLSVCQPKAWAIFQGSNIIESRDYFINYSGLILIHAGNLANNRQIKLVNRQMEAHKMSCPPLSTLPTQTIIGSAELVKCVWSDQAFDWGEAHTYHWYLEKGFLWEKPISFVSNNVLFEIPLHLVNS
jgi:hypothetical protein